MRVFLTIKNYRCFVEPVRIEIVNGFTAFVGQNNAGKSTVMRFLLELRRVFESIRPGQSMQNMFVQDSENISPMYVLDPQEIFSNLNEKDIVFSIEFEYTKSEDSENLPRSVEFIVRRTDFVVRAAIYSSTGRERIRNVSGFNGQSFAFDKKMFDLTHLFSVAKKLHNTLYIGPFRNTINIGTKSNYLDIDIGESFIRKFRGLKTGHSIQDNKAAIKLVDDIRHIFEFESLEINPSDDNQTLQIIVNRKPYKQHELGSGLLQFVVVLAHALIKKPSFVLIDEPELSLHPRLQLDFLTTIGSHCSSGVWFSTHSIGLARSSGGQIYSVLRRSDGDSIVKPFDGTPRLSEFLGEMSFSSYKELGFEKILLVEGRKDVPVFQQFLRKISKDHKVVLLPLSGNIDGGMADQLEELRRITPKISALVDSEKSGVDESLNPRRQAFVDLCKKFDIPIHVLVRRATENYFPDAAIKKVFGDAYRELAAYELLSNAQPHWRKSENYKIAREMTLTDLESTDFFSFLSAL